MLLLDGQRERPTEGTGRGRERGKGKKSREEKTEERTVCLARLRSSVVLAFALSAARERAITLESICCTGLIIAGVFDEPARTHRSRRDRCPLHRTIAISGSASTIALRAAQSAGARARARAARPLFAAPARRSTTLWMRPRRSSAASPRRAPQPAQSRCPRAPAAEAARAVPLLRARTAARCRRLARIHRRAAPRLPRHVARPEQRRSRCQHGVHLLSLARAHTPARAVPLSLGRWTSDSPALVGRRESNLRRVSSGRARGKRARTQRGLLRVVIRPPRRRSAQGGSTLVQERLQRDARPAGTLGDAAPGAESRASAELRVECPRAYRQQRQRVRAERIGARSPNPTIRRSDTARNAQNSLSAAQISILA